MWGVDAFGKWGGGMGGRGDSSGVSREGVIGW